MAYKLHLLLQFWEHWTTDHTHIYTRNGTQFITTLFVHKLLQFKIEKLNKSESVQQQ